MRRKKMFFLFGSTVISLVLLFSHNVPVFSSKNNCHTLISSSGIPNGYGAAYHLFTSGNPILLSAACDMDSAEITIGDGAETTYAYKDFYRWNGSSWNKETLSCRGKTENDWCIGEGTANLLGKDLKKMNYFAGYTCYKNGTRFQCGCRDTDCTNSYWQGQSFPFVSITPPPPPPPPPDEKVSLSPSSQNIKTGETVGAFTASGGSSFSFSLDAGTTGIRLDTTCSKTLSSSPTCHLSSPSSTGTAHITVTNEKGFSESATIDVSDSDDRRTAVPPLGESSHGSGGTAANGETHTTNGVTYRIITPSGNGPHPLMIVFSGTEGDNIMTRNIKYLSSVYNMTDIMYVILNGMTYYNNGQAGAVALDDVRSRYNIDNDKTYLFSESAGTQAGLSLGFSLRESYFAAFWANDVNASAVPQKTAEEIGFHPYGNAGPGGHFDEANTIVHGMETAGYKTPEPSPYDGTGADTHGSEAQLRAAFQWFKGKKREQ